jgi:hypothetical protein
VVLALNAKAVGHGSAPLFQNIAKAVQHFVDNKGWRCLDLPSVANSDIKRTDLRANNNAGRLCASRGERDSETGQ